MIIFIVGRVAHTRFPEKQSLFSRDALLLNIVTLLFKRRRAAIAQRIILRMTQEWNYHQDNSNKKNQLDFIHGWVITTCFIYYYFIDTLAQASFALCGKSMEV